LKDYLLNKLVGRLRRADEGMAVANFLSPRRAWLAPYFGSGSTLENLRRARMKIFIRHNIPHHDLAALPELRARLPTEF
jgi:hypothetical protein